MTELNMRKKLSSRRDTDAFVTKLQYVAERVFSTAFYDDEMASPAQQLPPGWTAEW